MLIPSKVPTEQYWIDTVHWNQLSKWSEQSTESEIVRNHPTNKQHDIKVIFNI